MLSSILVQHKWKLLKVRFQIPPNLSLTFRIPPPNCRKVLTFYSQKVPPKQNTKTENIVFKNFHLRTGVRNQQTKDKSSRPDGEGSPLLHNWQNTERDPNDCGLSGQWIEETISHSYSHTGKQSFTNINSDFPSKCPVTWGYSRSSGTVSFTDPNIHLLFTACGVKSW